MPSKPPRDASGKIVAHDHLEILGSHHLIRRITPKDLHPPDGPSRRISSGAYSESSDGGMSVDIEEWLLAAGLSALHYITEPSHGAVRINVKKLRDAGFTVGWDPDGGHPQHGAVWGIGNGSTRRRQIAKMAVSVKKAAGEA